MSSKKNNSKDPLKELKKARDDILKAEIAALLFNLGKTHIGFWRKRGLADQNEKFPEYEFGDYKDYFKKIKEKGKSPFELDAESLGKNINFFAEKIEILNLKSKFIEIMKMGGQFKQIFESCERANSSIDKGQMSKGDSLRDINKLHHRWISNAYGAYVDDVPFSLLDEERRNFLKKLFELIDQKQNSTDFSWSDFRQEVYKIIQKWYQKLLSDTRFPMNDVTLWDQVYMTASLFKASLAAVLLNSDKKNDQREIKWSILGVQYDKLSLAEKGLKAHYIQGYRDLTWEMDRAVKEKIELEYAIGNEIYRDESGIYFVVPENATNDNSDVETGLFDLHKNLKDLQDDIIRIFYDSFQLEVFPSIKLTKPSRKIFNITELIRNAKKNFLQPNYPKDLAEKIKVIDSEKSSKNSGLCRVCGIRFVVESDEVPVCLTCAKRKRSRIYKWLEGKETIWTAELQDKNGRIALVTLKFELEKWLDGTLLNSTFMQIPEDWEFLVQKLKEDLRNNQNKQLEETCLKEYVDQSRNVIEKKLSEFAEIILFDGEIGGPWENLLKQNSQENNGKINILWSKLDENDYTIIAHILLLFLLRRNPSPARLRRIWETTRGFLEDIQRNIDDDLELPEWRKKRIVWDLNVKKNGGPPDGQYQFKGLDFWVANGQVRLTTSLEKAIPVLSKPGQELDSVQKQIHKGDIEWLRDQIRLKKVNEDYEFDLLVDSNTKYEEYSPYFSILDPTPISWQVIVPAASVGEWISRIQERYYKAFAYVYGKLPMHIGVVTQQYKKPLYTGIQALRRIRRDIDSWRDIQQTMDIEQISDELRDKQNVKLQEKPERFYSYYEIANKNEDSTEWSGPYTIDFHSGKMVNLGSISDLRNVSVNIYPNTIDFEFLDVNTRRNDIFYKNGKRIISEKNGRPYSWGEWKLFTRFRDYFLQPEQQGKLQSLIQLGYSTNHDWENHMESRKRMLLSAMINIFGLKSKDRDKVAEFFDCNSWEQLNEMQVIEFHKKWIRFTDMFLFWHQTLKVEGNISKERGATANVY